MPEIIDIHTHGIGGYDTRTTTEMDILKMAELHASSGVSRILPTIYPDEIEAMRENMMAVKRAMEIQDLRPRTQDLKLKKTATILGVHLEGPFLNPEKCGALDKKAFIKPTDYNLMALLDGFEDMVRIITIAPELDGALRLIRKISRIGIIVSMGHSDATYNEAEAGFHAGAKGVTHIFNAMRWFHHREPGIAGFGLLNRDIYIEVIADPYHLHPEIIELIFRIKEPDKIIIVSDSVKETKPSRGHAIVNNSGRPRGGSMTILESSKRLIELGVEEEVIRGSITKNPAMYLIR